MLRCVSVVGCTVGFYLPLAAIPLYAATSSRSAAGVANGALLVASVVGELVTPRLVAALGYRRTLAAGLALLGGPTLILLASESVPVIVTDVPPAVLPEDGLTPVTAGAAAAV